MNEQVNEVATEVKVDGTKANPTSVVVKEESKEDKHAVEHREHAEHLGHIL